MTNTVLTHQMIARLAAAMLEEEAPFLANINKGRQEEFGKNVSGYQKGDTVKIKIPTAGQVFDGAKFAEGNGASAFIEEYVNLSLDTQKHVALQFGAKEKLLDLTDFKDRILRPQMQTLASVIEADLIARGVVSVPNQVSMSLTNGKSSHALSLARAKMNNYLTPAGDRSVILSSDANVALSDEVSRMSNPTTASNKAYLQGYVNTAYGADLYEHQSVAVFNNGDANGLTVVGAGQTGKTLIVKGAGALTKGTIFNIAGVNAVHPLTGQDYGQLQDFVVNETVTLGDNTTISIFPALNDNAPNKTTSALPANGAAITVKSVNGFQNLEFHKDAFTTAFAPLPVLASCEGYTARLPSGVSVRVMTFGDGNNDYERTRIDVLYGFQTVRPLHACRIIQS